MGYNKSVAAPGTLKARILELLAESPIGMGTSEIASALEVTEGGTSSSCNGLQRIGLVIGVHAGAGKAHQKRRWCVPQHEATCRADVLVAPAKSAMWSKSGLGRIDPAAKVVGPIPEVKVVVGFEDNRFRVDADEAPMVFRALRPGQYLPADTWAAKVYG